MFTGPNLTRDLTDLGLQHGDTVMVHSSLRSLGYVLGGPQTVVRSLLNAVGETGTLVMPAFSPAVGAPANSADQEVRDADRDLTRQHIPAFDDATTPTSMGTVPEVFRTWPGVRRSPHPQVSVCSHGPLSQTISEPHELDWAEGANSPFERLYQMDARLLLIGVGFNRATMLHFAESLVPHGRRKTREIPLGDGTNRTWVTAPDVGDDLDTHFPIIGNGVRNAGLTTIGNVGDAECSLISMQVLVDWAVDYLSTALS